MDDEDERQRRDLQRATRLLETMPREEMVEMLLDILSNERSDDTRKLSDWMAFQIILHDDIRRGHELLTQLGKGGRTHRWSQTSQTSSASRHCPTPAGQDSKLQLGHLEEASSSTDSFSTCPEVEPVNAIEPNDKATEEAAPSAVQVFSGKLQDATVTEVDEKHEHGDILAISESEEKSLNRARANPTSWMPRWRDAILRRKPRAPPEPTTGREELPQPKAPATPASSRRQPITAQDSFGPRLHPRVRGSGEAPQKSSKPKSIGVTNKAGHKNLAELYARHDKVQQEGKDAFFWCEYDDPTFHDLEVSKREEALGLDWLKKMPCVHCKLYFTHEQNVRDLDNGSSPCSYHPGKALRMSAGGGSPAWTCCQHEISLEDFVSGPKKSPGCVSGYHLNWKEFRCCVCGQLFTEEKNGYQLDGSPPCSYHPGDAVPDARVGEVWTCCMATAHSKGLRWDWRWDSRSPGCTALYHMWGPEYSYRKERNMGMPLFP